MKEGNVHPTWIPRNKRSLERSLGDALTDWSSAAGEARSSRFERKLKEVGEDLTARVILGAEHWFTDKVGNDPNYLSNWTKLELEYLMGLFSKNSRNVFFDTLYAPSCSCHRWRKIQLVWRESCASPSRGPNQPLAWHTCSLPLSSGAQNGFFKIFISHIVLIVSSS